MRLMTTPGGWQTGRTGIGLAQEWGIALNTVERDAAEASRRVREDLFDREEMRAQLVAQLQVVTAVALRARKTRDAVAAIAEVAKMLGLNEQTVRLDQGEREGVMRAIRGAVDDETWMRIVGALGGSSGGSDSSDSGIE